MELDTQLNASDRSTRETISKNFQTIQSEDAKDDGAFTKYQKETNDRLDKLDAEKATHDDVEELSQLIQQFEEKITKQVDADHQELVSLVNNNYQKMNDKAERVALGIDRDTVCQVVMLILQEQGIVPATTEIPKIKDPDKAASAAGEVAAVSSGEDSRAQAASAALAELNLPKE